jgi:hypothetical protein
MMLTRSNEFSFFFFLFSLSFSFSPFSHLLIRNFEQKASDEGNKLKPWTLIAKAKLKAEEELKNIAG